MEGLIPLLILTAIVCLLSGPVALIVGLLTLQRVRQLERQARPAAPPPAAEPVEPTAVVAEAPEPVAAAPPEPIVEPVAATMVAPVAPEPESLSLEQQIGTRWVLAAGVITVIFAVGFFLKYAYDNQWIGPLGRVVVAGLSGLVALAVGELTRRRGYGVVAKGVTALGFAILYATVFTAHRWYGLIDPAVGFVLATAITLGAMLYAVRFDEIIAAMLALAGGYLTPVIVSTGQNLPTPLFSYVLILSLGAMLCAAWRHWAPVNLLAGVGTVVLYTGWFEKFYRPTMSDVALPDQAGVALFWLTVFFALYLAAPLLEALVRRVRAQMQDVALVLANAAVVFYYLWTILIDLHRAELAWCSLALGVVYLAVMGLAAIRCPSDIDLRRVLLAIGLAFVTLAVPLRLTHYAVPAVWAAQAVLLAVIGLRYRSPLLELAAGVVLALTIGALLRQLPLHRGTFRFALNPAFGTWCLVAVATLAGHLVYRRDRGRVANAIVAEGLYVGALLLGMAAISLELWHYDRLTLPRGSDPVFFARQMVLVCAVFLLPLAARPLRPRGQIAPTAAALIGIGGTFWILANQGTVHTQAFAIFLNLDFIRPLALVASLFAAAWLARDLGDRSSPANALPVFFALAGVVLLWLLLTGEIWHFWRCRNRFGPPTVQWRFLAHMCISVLWALYASGLMVVGFWRKLYLLRYLALGLFVLLLAKIFLLDTRTLETVYRIAGFLATGLALVGISYLYQFLKKQGFFERMLTEGPKDA